MSSEARRGKSAEEPASGVDQYLVKDPQQFALNLARMVEQAGKAAAAWVEPREKGDIADSGVEPLADMVKTFSRVAEYWLSDPIRALEAQTRLFAGYLAIWGTALRKASGTDDAPDEIAAEPGDKRFRDPEWSRNAFFQFLKQTYLVTSRWLADLVEHAEGLDDHTRHKAKFYVRQVTDALSPSNFILTNPEVLRETVASNGENLVRGMKMLAEDIVSGKGEVKLRQADHSKFELGVNVATTPGKVVGRSDLAEIIQYEPSTARVLKRPLLICPPWINKFYILDLNPEKSFIRWAVEQGHTVFVVSWVNPDERHGTMDWEAYARDGIRYGLDIIEQTTGERQVNAIGYCVGGTLLAAALALMARQGEGDRVASVTFFATQVDFTHAGDLKVFVDEDQVAAIERTMRGKGYLEGTRMAAAFNMLRSGDLIWPYVVNNYMRGREPPPFDLLYWNADATRMAAANHSYYLRNCYLENNLSQGHMKLGGHTLSLSDIDIPVYNLATKDDHIAPARSVFLGSRYFGGDVEFVVSGSGHIAGVVNPPHLGKYQYWTDGKPEGEFETWMQAATEHKGSWWPHWQKWILARDRRKVAARKAGKGVEVLGEAPGTFVKVRV